jgi:hypothetical protein
MSINVSIMVCDDIRFEQNGKMFLIGVYNNDLGIGAPGAVVPQLMFLFSVDGPLAERPKEITLEVTLPGGAPIGSTFPVPLADSLLETLPGRTRWFMRNVIAIQNTELNPGRIVARVAVDGVDVTVSTPWISVTESLREMEASVSSETLPPS